MLALKMLQRSNLTRASLSLARWRAFVFLADFSTTAPQAESRQSAAAQPHFRYITAKEKVRAQKAAPLCVMWTIYFKLYSSGDHVKMWSAERVVSAAQVLRS